jgi:hypothetical protein
VSLSGIQFLKIKAPGFRLKTCRNDGDGCLLVKKRLNKDFFDTDLLSKQKAIPAPEGPDFFLGAGIPSSFFYDFKSPYRLLTFQSLF